MDNTNQYQYKLTKYRHLSKKNPNNPVYANKIQKYQTLLQVSQIQQGGEGKDLLNGIDLKNLLKGFNLKNLLNGIDLNEVKQTINKFTTEIGKLLSPEALNYILDPEKLKNILSR